MNDTARRKAANFDQLYPGRFLKAGEFEGKKVTLTITDAFVEDLEGETGVKPKAIVTFKETPKALVACKTNGLCLKGMFGSAIADWVGKRVTLFPDTWNGEPCIRVFGSPDIDAPIGVEIKLPKRKPFTKTMQPTGRANAKPPAAPTREPGQD